MTVAKAPLTGPELRLINMVVDLTFAVSRLSDAVHMLSVTADPNLKADVRSAQQEAATKVSTIFKDVKELLAGDG